MNYHDESNANRWRFSKEITLGDLMLAITVGFPLIVAAVRLSDRVEDHDRRISAAETAVSQHTARLAQQDTQIAVLQAEGRAPVIKP